ncbi:MAG: hypothetical protein AAGC46_20900, partial [Solirubrobacteraceae bacterium]
PLSVSMAELGSDKVVTSGQPAKVVVQVEGEDDGTLEAIDLKLRYTGDITGAYTYTDLATVPTEPGVHELTVTIPTGLPPSVARVNEYVFLAKVRRTKGVEADALSPVDVIGRPEDLYWPDGPRGGQHNGEEIVRIEITVDSETVELGGSISGTVSLFAPAPLPKADVRLTLGATITAAAGPQNKVSDTFREFGRQELVHGASLGLGERVELPFKAAVPADAPPTVDSGGHGKIVWSIRVGVGKVTAWRTIGVLDPDASAGNRNNPQRAASWLLIDGH